MANSKSTKDYKPIVGSCLTMCPQNEIILRQRENLIHLLECKVNSQGMRTRFGDQQKMVKEFSRPAAGQLIEAATVRPLLVLQRTVTYLLSSVCSANDVSWREIYEFVDNRLRAIRQDITVQALNSHEVVKVLAPAARFYVYAHYRFSEYEDSNFDPHLNLTQLHETLLTILSIYKDSSYLFESPIVDLEQLKLKSEQSDESFDEEDEEDEEEDCDNMLRPNSFVSRDQAILQGEVSLLSSLENMKLNESSQLKPDFVNTKDCNNHNLDFETTSDSAFENTDFNSYSNVKNMEKCSVEFKFSNENLENGTSLANIHRYSVMEEMLALYLLIHFGNNEALTYALQLPKQIRCSELIASVFKTSLSWMLGNHFPLIRLSVRLPPILSCALHLHLNKVQRHALGVLSVGHSSKALTYKTKELLNYLLFPSPESLIKACSYYGLSATEECVQFFKSNFKWDAAVLKPEKANWVEIKLKQYTVAEMLLP